jgi:hypothetical protein
VTRRAGADAREDAAPESRPDVSDRPLDGGLEIEAEREVRRDRR